MESSNSWSQRNGFPMSNYSCLLCIIKQGFT